ncbi:MAG: glycine betaine ABC transporter substrate-binding protein [Desulfobacterales bacterium]
MMIFTKKRFFFTAGALCLVLLLMFGGPATAQESKSINIGWTAWSSTEATTNLVKRILEEKMGYSVKMTLADIGIMYQGLAEGQIDLMLMAWLPETHKNYHEKTCGQVMNLGPFYLNARLGWVVPSYIPESELASIEDLKKPEVAEKLNGQIQGIDPGAGLMQLSEKAIEAYGLENYKLVSSSGAGMTAALSRAVRNEEWVVVTGWSPHWKFGKWDLRYLEDPKGSLGGLEQVSVLARTGFYQDHPEVVAFLCRMFLPLEDLEAMMLKANETSYEQAAEEYIEANPERVKYWVTGKLASQKAKTK